MIYIVIPVFNRLNYTRACIDSILQQTFKDFKIIIVDDGSTDGTSEVVSKNYPEVIVLKTPGDRWWSASMNVGIQYAMENQVTPDDFVLSLNNDLVIEPDYLEQMTTLARLHPKSILGSIAVDISSKSVEYVGLHWNPYLATKRRLLKRGLSLEHIQRSHEYLTTSLLPGRGILIPYSCFKAIGLFDELTFPHYAGDYDFSLRAKQAGYKLIINTRAVVFSHVKETALAAMGKLPIGTHLKQTLTSIKSPVNIATHYRFAKRHAASPPLVYFTIDMLRISKSLILTMLKR